MNTLKDAILEDVQDLFNKVMRMREDGENDLRTVLFYIASMQKKFVDTL